MLYFHIIWVCAVFTLLVIGVVATIVPTKLWRPGLRHPIRHRRQKKWLKRLQNLDVSPERLVQLEQDVCEGSKLPELTTMYAGIPTAEELKEK